MGELLTTGGLVDHPNGSGYMVTREAAKEWLKANGHEQADKPEPKPLEIVTTNNLVESKEKPGLMVHEKPKEKPNLKGKKGKKAMKEE